MMLDIEALRKIALSFPETKEQPHFEKTSFRIGKKIFVTMDININLACVKLSLADQDLFSVFDQSIVYPVPNKWGQQGWTFVNLEKIDPDVFTDIVTTSYCEVAPKKFSALIRREDNTKTDL